MLKLTEAYVSSDDIYTFERASLIFNVLIIPARELRAIDIV